MKYTEILKLNNCKKCDAPANLYLSIVGTPGFTWEYIGCSKCKQRSNNFHTMKEYRKAVELWNKNNS